MAVLALAVHWQMVKAGSQTPQTMVLTVVSFSQLAHVLAIRSERQSLLSLGLFSNAPLLGAVALTAVLQVCVIYVPFMNEWFRTVPLSGQEMAVAVALSSLVFVAVEAEKWLVRRGWVQYRS